MQDRVYETEVFIPNGIDEVFEYFRDAKNLEEITPPWLNFKVLGQTTPAIEEGTEFWYRLKIRGIPVRWRSRIINWKPPHQFTDIQLKGPYSRWHHTHTFEPRDGGTLMKDIVLYRLPLGWLGDALGGWYVRRDVETIFKYRRKVILEKFGSGSESAVRF